MSWFETMLSTFDDFVEKTEHWFDGESEQTLHDKELNTFANLPFSESVHNEAEHRRRHASFEMPDFLQPVRERGKFLNDLEARIGASAAAASENRAMATSVREYSEARARGQRCGCTIL